MLNKVKPYFSCMNTIFIDKRFEEACRKNGENVALVLEDGVSSLTYSQLDEAANELSTVLSQLLAYIDANEIVEKSTNPMISLMTDRNISMVVSILAILKSGAAYVPIDPSFPPDRQTYIFEHSKSSILIIDSFCYGHPDSLNVSLVPFLIVVDSATCKVIQKPEFFLTSQPRSFSRAENDMAYVLYTSGSTGKPKGVMVTHKGVDNIVQWFANTLQIDSSSIVLGLTTFCFDISVLEMFMPLFCGGTLVIASSLTQKDPFRLQRVLTERKINVMQATPTTYEMLLAAGWRGGVHLNLMVGCSVTLG